MNHNEKIAKARELFGAPLGHLPEYWPGWDGPPCTLFWAPANKWNSLILRDQKIPYKFTGPFSAAETPFPVHCDGYSIIILDDDGK